MVRNCHLLSSSELSMLLSFFSSRDELDHIIRKKWDWYSKLVDHFTVLAKDGINEREIGSLIGTLARADDDLNVKLQSKGINPVDHGSADPIRELFGMRVYEDP